MSKSSSESRTCCIRSPTVTADSPVLLELRHVRFGFPTRRDFLGPISLAVRAGECWAIVGPNGAGKSTLLRLMAGLANPDDGEIQLNDESLRHVSSRRRARQIAFVPQRVPGDLDLCVRDVVLMGRFPHRSMSLFESPADYRIADRAMQITATHSFSARPLATLSGGEAQRVHVAAALAQEPRILLLDEPTASLDLQHQLAIFHILQQRACTDGLAVVVVTHDVNLAARYCTHVLLLHEGKAVASGTPPDVLTPEILEPVYEVKLAVFGPSDRPWLVPLASRH
jgi:iron complex transport system ATP-binding protein